MSAETDRILVKGLLAGYASAEKPVAIHRGHFAGKKSELPPNSGGIYNDEWFAHLRGGGQELVAIGDETATRLYAGGTIDQAELEKLGITEGQVSEQLKKAITEAGERTRLHEDYIPEANGDWSYQYRVLARVAELELTVGLEELSYKDNLTFAHYFLISPVK